MFRRPDVIPLGQRHQDARPTVSRKPSRTVWIVERLLDIGKMRHVRRVDEGAPSRSKVIAMTALAERKLYTPLKPYSSSGERVTHVDFSMIARGPL